MVIVKEQYIISGNEFMQTVPDKIEGGKTSHTVCKKNKGQFYQTGNEKNYFCDNMKTCCMKKHDGRGSKNMYFFKISFVKTI